jgi:DNA-directed RNA polymerase specialized sigma subunit
VNIPFDEELYVEPERVTKDLENRELLEKMLPLVAGDKKLTNMVEILFEEPSLRSSELAEKLGVSVHELYYLKKRLRDRLSKLVHDR